MQKKSYRLRRPRRLAVLLTTILAAASMAALGARPFAQEDRGGEERFSATAINMGTRGPATVDRVDIVVKQWSPRIQRDRLIGVLFEKGPDKLLDVLQDLPTVGYFKTPESLAYDIHYAQRTPLPEGGERVVLATDRHIRFWEVARGSRTTDYPFTIIELRLNGDGRGEGKMSIATRVLADKKKNEVVLENWGTQPVLLKDVRRER
jgi:hypothetical protein